MERETGIEPATNSLEGCDSTTELLPPSRLAPPHSHSPLRRGRPAYVPRLAWPPSARSDSGGQARLRASRDSLRVSPSSVMAIARCRPPPLLRSFGATDFTRWLAETKLAARSQRAKSGGEGRIRTSEAAGATDLQSAAFDRFATSPICISPHPSLNNERGLNKEPAFKKERASARQAESATRCSCSSRRIVWIFAVCDVPCGTARNPLSCSYLWSWRRDSNPRPADYKSAALPD